MKKIILNVLIGLLFIGGGAVMLYPAISNYMNEGRQSDVIANYQQMIDSAGEAERAEEMEKAHAYNTEVLPALSAEGAAQIEQNAAYQSILNLSGDGVMGVLDIDRIDIHLPIYHGTSDAVMQVGVGHLPETSLPVGGEGTHCVLSAHTGLPSAKLFTDLDEMREGDIFKITVLDEVLVYQVDQIKIVEPDDTGDMHIVEGKDYVTLLTCTPYGINSHRLLVRGVRIPYEEAKAQGLLAETDAVFLDKTLLLPFAIVPVVLIYFIWTLFRTLPNRKRTDLGKEDL